MARKNMWSATAAVGDAELRGVPEGYAPAHDGTIELPRAMPGPSSNVYTVGRLGGAHRRSDKPGKPAPKSGRSASTDTGEWTSIWPDDQPTVPRAAPTSPPPAPPSPGRSGYDRGLSGYDQGPPAYDRGPAAYDAGPTGYDAGPAGYGAGPTAYDAGPTAYDAGPAGYDGGVGAYDGGVSAYGGRGAAPTRPTSGSRTEGFRTEAFRAEGSRADAARAGGSRPGTPGGHARPKAGSRRAKSRPMRYTGARRKFSSWAPLAGGVLMLVLVLGATMLAEADRYTGSSSSALDGTPTSQPAAANPPKQQQQQRKTTVAAPGSEEVAAAINKELDLLGCGRVKVDPTLVAAAGDHVDDMLSKGYFDTAAPGGGSSFDRAKNVGYDGTKVIESVVSGAGNPAEAARAAFPAPDATGALPATVKVVSGGKLTCGWTAVGAEVRMNSKSVVYWSIVLGQ